MIEIIMTNKIDNLYGDEIIPEEVIIKMSYTDYLHYKSEFKIWNEVNQKNCNTCIRRNKTKYCPNWGEPVVYRCTLWEKENNKI